jgi:hypothetical protein
MTGFAAVIQPKAPGAQVGIWKLKFLNGIKGVNGCAMGACLTPPPFKEKEQRSTTRRPLTLDPFHGSPLTLDPFHERPAARRAKGLLSPALSSRKGGEGDLLLGGRLAINMALLRSFCRERDGGKPWETRVYEPRKTPLSRSISFARGAG